MRQLRPYGALVLAVASWGVAISAGKYAIDQIGPVTTLFVEAGTAAAVLWLAMLRVRPKRTVPLRYYLYLGLLEPVLTYGALNLGLQRTGAADAALLTALLPMMVLVLGVIFVREPVSARGVGSLLTGTAGAALLGGAHLTVKAGIGDGLVLLASLGAAASVLVVSRLAQQASSLELTAFQFGVGFVVVTPVALARWASGAEAVPGAAQLPQLAAAAAIGLIGFTAAYLAYNYAVGHVSVTMAGMSLNLIPVFGVATAIVWLGEELTPLKWIGGGLIFLGVAVFPYTEDAHPHVAPPEAEELNRYKASR